MGLGLPLDAGWPASRAQLARLIVHDSQSTLDRRAVRTGSQPRAAFLMHPLPVRPAVVCRVMLELRTLRSFGGHGLFGLGGLLVCGGLGSSGTHCGARCAAARNTANIAKRANIANMAWRVKTLLLFFLYPIPMGRADHTDDPARAAQRPATSAPGHTQQLAATSGSLRRTALGPAQRCSRLPLLARVRRSTPSGRWRRSPPCKRPVRLRSEQPAPAPLPAPCLLTASWGGQQPTLVHFERGVRRLPGVRTRRLAPYGMLLKPSAPNPLPACNTAASCARLSTRQRQSWAHCRHDSTARPNTSVATRDTCC
jgi:hypothetical protein